jgi:transposase-like protein
MVKSRTPRGGGTKLKRPRIAPEVREEALRLVRSGVSNLEIAKRLGIAEGSVRYMRRQTDAAAIPDPVVEALSVPRVEHPPHEVELEPADVGIPADASPEAALAQVDLMIADLNRLASEAKKDTNYTAAARASRDAANLFPLRDRLRKAVQAGSGDAVTIPREKIDAEIEAIYGRARTLASVEMCPRCGCELRMAAVGAARETNKEKP